MRQQTACGSFCNTAVLNGIRPDIYGEMPISMYGGNPDNPKLLKKALLECPNEMVKRDTEEIQYNVPGLFIDEGEE